MARYKSLVISYGSKTMIKLQKKVFKFDYDGNEITLKAPSVSDASELQKKINEKGESIDVIIDFLERIGLKKEISSEMEVDHLNTILETVVGSKKN